jgi:hypothetical protein
LIALLLQAADGNKVDVASSDSDAAERLMLMLMWR